MTQPLIFVYTWLLHRAAMNWRNDLSTGVFLASDVCGIVSGFYLAFAIRTLLNPFFLEQFDFSLVHSVSFPVYLTASIWLLTFRQLGLYQRERRFQLARMFLQIVKGSTFVAVVLVIASFFAFRDVYSRSLLVLLLPASVVTITGWRMAIVGVVRWLTRQGYGAERVAVVGTEESARRLAARLKRQPALVVCGYIGLDSESPRALGLDLPYLGALAEVGELIEKHQLSRIVCQNEIRSREQAVRLAEICRAGGAAFDLVPDFFKVVPYRMQLTDLGGIPLINVRSIEMSRWDGFVKRLLDLATAAVALVLLSPLVLVIAILVAAESPGGVIYRQSRLGKDGRRFTFLKFRSMCADAHDQRQDLISRNEVDGALFKIRDDPRRTRVGRFIRRHSLDELPQLVNVLRGEMSLVGPRPLPFEDLEKLDMARYAYWFGQRLRVLPGLTGLWQVSGRSKLSFEEMVELDIYYMENWSLTLDFEIMLKTISEVVSGRGAY